MLKYLRKNTKIVLWLVVISFAICGGYSFSSAFLDKQANYAGEAFGKKVSFQEFQKFQRANQIFSFRKDAPQDPELIRTFTWESLVLAREAKRLGIQVSDEEVKSNIARFLAAQGIERPTPALYQQWLSRAFNEKPRAFEEKLREFIRIQKLIRQSNADIKPPEEADVREFFLLDQNAVSVKMARFESKAEAEAFALAARTAKDPLTAFESGKVKPDTIEMTGIGKLAYALRMQEKDVKALHALAPGNVSDPLPSGPQFAVFYLLDKKIVAESGFTDEVKKDYTEKLTQQKQSLNYYRWRMEILARAKVKDYSEPPESPLPDTP